MGPDELASWSGPARHGQHGLGQVALPAARRAGGPKAEGPLTGGVPHLVLPPAFPLHCGLHLPLLALCQGLGYQELQVIHGSSGCCLGQLKASTLSAGRCAPHSALLSMSFKKIKHFHFGIISD